MVGRMRAAAKGKKQAAEVDSRPLIDFRCLKPAGTPRHSRGSARQNNHITCTRGR